MSDILIIDDDKMLCEMLSRKLQYLGHNTTIANTLSHGLKIGLRSAFDLVLLDVRLPDGSGLEAIPRFNSSESQPEVIIITGEGDPDGAELAIETGAWDYIEKPLSMREISLQVTRALQYHEGKTTRRPARLLKREGIIGSDPKMESCLEKVAQASNTDTPVLITGETGTGKELFARAVHTNSHRAEGSFVVLDCATLPENLVESILFGHCKGAYTGAHHHSDGLILGADHGTLFLDEVGELPPAVQKAFLRVLQEHRFRPVGSRQEVESDFRLVAATNRDLDEMVQRDRFREDLLFRLRASSIHLPSLKKRKGDIEPLVLHFISRFCKQYNMGVKGVSSEFIETLNIYSWPGNVRELANAIDSAVANASEYDVLFPMHLPANIRISLKRQTIGKGTPKKIPKPHEKKADTPLPDLKTTIENCEKQYFEFLMNQTHGNIKDACKISGLSRSGLYGRLKKYNIERPA